MENNFEKQRKGGKREGAGRKSKDKDLRSKNFTIRVTEDDYSKIKSIDGFTDKFLEWLRAL